MHLLWANEFQTITSILNEFCDIIIQFEEFVDLKFHVNEFHNHMLKEFNGAKINLVKRENVR